MTSTYDLDAIERHMKSTDMLERLAGMQAGVEALPAMIADLRAMKSELRKWKTPSTDERLSGMREQYEDSPTSRAATTGYINALVCTLAQRDADLRAMREMLERLEWSGSDTSWGRDHVCPECRVSRPEENYDILEVSARAHAPDCGLAALLHRTPATGRG